MSGVTIKPLMWDNFGLEMWADSIVGKYRISGHGGKWSWTFDDDDPYHHGEIAGSEDEAKSACKKHFDVQIRSVIDDTRDALIKELVAALIPASQALPEAAAILGGEYSDHYQPLADMMLEFEGRVDAALTRANEAGYGAQERNGDES